MDLADRFFAERFRKRFTRNARPVKRRTSASAEIEALLGSTLSHALTAFVDILGSHERDSRYGAFGWFGSQGGWSIDWLPGRKNALDHALEQPFRYPAMLASALAIGCDHGGNSWLVSFDSAQAKNRVYLVDHDTDEPRPVADSIEAFTLLMDICDRENKPNREERAALNGRVDWSFDERADGSGLALAAQSETMTRYAETADLRVLFRGARSNPPPAMPRPGRRSRASDVVADLLRLYICGEQRRLTRMLDRNVVHRAKLVRDAVTRVRALSPGTKVPAGEPPQFHRVRQLCPWIPKHSQLEIEAAIRRASACLDAQNWDGVLDAYSILPAKTRANDLSVVSGSAYAFQSLGQHEKAIAAFQRAIALDATRPRLFAAICYSLGELERWEEMRDAATRAVELDCTSSYAFQQLAIARAEKGDLVGSIAAGERALALDPTNAFAMFQLAIAYAKSRNTKAVGLLRRAVILAPSLAEAAEDRDIRALFATLAR